MCGQVLAAVADSWIDESSSSSNKGSDLVLKVMSKGGANLRALLRFNLPSIPAGCVLDNATLRVYAGSTSSSQRTLQVFRLGGSWTEGGVTWANAPATTGTAVTTTSGIGYRQWAVAPLVLALYSSGSNNGFLLRDATEGQDAEQQFYSSEEGREPAAGRAHVQTGVTGVATGARQRHLTAARRANAPPRLVLTFC